MQHSGTVQDALQLLTERVVAFKIHAFIKAKQAKTFNDMHTATRPGQASMQIDFSENATILQQDEIQSAYWTHGQCALFTSVAWTDEGTHSYGVASESLP